MEKRDYYTWEQFEQDCAKIVRWAKGKKFKNVYGIPRGGLVVAVKLSHLLDIPLVLHAEDVSPDTLVVDDIVDTGGTIERIFAIPRKKIRIASLYLNPKARMKPDYFVQKRKSWVVFPWETGATSKYDRTV